jgi:repressor LexA
MRDIEQKILDFIGRFCFEEQRSPTLAEIATGVGYTSRGSIHRYVTSLLDDGFLHSDGGNKNLQCTGKPVSDLTLPMLGKIAAGRPIEAIAQSMELNITHLFAGPNRFVLQVTGESMIEAGIHDGDYVIVQQSSSARNGEIVVALIDNDEATLKRFYTISDNRIRLVPENSSMEPMNFRDDQVQIQGIVVGQMRTY